MYPCEKPEDSLELILGGRSSLDDESITRIVGALVKIQIINNVERSDGLTSEQFLQNDMMAIGGFNLDCVDGSLGTPEDLVKRSPMNTRRVNGRIVDGLFSVSKELV